MKNEKPVILSLKVVEWVETNPEYNTKCYPEHYVLGLDCNEYKRFDLQGSYYFKSDITEKYSIEDVTCSYEGFGFWAKSDKPLLELACRIYSFEKICSDVIHELKAKQNIFNLTLNTLPKELEEMFTPLFIERWVEVTSPFDTIISGNISDTFKKLETFVYKWRKMVELYENVCREPELINYLYKLRRDNL